MATAAASTRSPEARTKLTFAKEPDFQPARKASSIGSGPSSFEQAASAGNSNEAATRERTILGRRTFARRAMRALCRKEPCPWEPVLSDSGLPGAVSVAPERVPGRGCWLGWG
ncbi:hypothetical protein GCM10009679_29380 [Saccharothrix algeriensis]|uniref:Uncharacterized protein n=1 Tax=Catellatospora bangladeshensis TaxID=310355 RepID=A0A8J3NFU3_9ACTN|nr:hypothetical protein Cba03nite_10410 [Catellatospora bangladeshensis]